MTRITVMAMHRRLLGGVVVLAVLMVAIVAPNWSERRVAGQPVAVAVAGPPAVGDCVTSVPDIRQLFGSGWDDAIDFPSTEFAACDGPVMGEVSSVHPAAGSPDRITMGDYQTSASQCALESIGYTGSIPPVVDGSVDRPSIVGAPAINFQNTPVGPTAIQRAVGQRWSACIVGAPTGKPYVGKLAGVLDAGQLPADFANCWLSDGLRDSEQVGCDEPHRVELLGTTGLGSAPYTAAEVQQSCVTYVGRVLRSDDPTHGGAIDFKILDFDETISVVDPSEALLKDTYVTCIASTRDDLRLTGSLVGLEDRPLPVG